MKYKCEACQQPKLTFNMLRFSPYCVECQIIANELFKPPKMAKMLNDYLKKNFRINEEEVEKNRKLAYWNKGRRVFSQ